MERASVTLSTKSWHYKLIKWTLGDNAPTPWNMHNLCPYFWLLIFSILVQPLFAPLKAIALGFEKLVTIMEKIIDAATTPTANDWFNNLSDYQAYFLWEQWWFEDRTVNDTRIPYNYKSVKKMTARDLLEKWLLEKRGIHMYKPNAKQGYWKEHTDEYNEWKLEISNKVSAERDVNPPAPKIPKATPKVKIIGEQIGAAVDGLLVRLSRAFNGWKSIITWTKRVVGAAITAAGLLGTFFIVQFAGRGIIWTVQNWNWTVFFAALAVLAAMGILALLMWGIGKLAEYIKDKDYDLWYVKAIYYAILLPLKWVFVDFIWGILIFTILWKFLAVTILWGGAKLLWKGLVGFLGIFGEYFGASYGDYCPGIEWKEENE